MSHFRLPAGNVPGVLGLGGSPVTLADRRVVLFNWRDTANAEGGGSERYVENIARGLVARGAHVTVFCAEHPGAPRDEWVEGVRFVRRGTKLAVYARGLLHLATRRFGRVDLVVDVQNGLPFFTRLGTRAPVVVLVHHVHREQWPVVYPGLAGRFGWWVESRVAPRLYRRSQYVAVSRATREELVGLGVDRSRIAVVHNGTDVETPEDLPRSAVPTVCVVGRLVPHKRVEHAVDAVAELSADLPDLQLVVAGAGWWEEELRSYARSRGVADRVHFEGFVDEHRKHEIYAASWVMALPSLKEGWGLVVGEAGLHRTPTVAYAAAGGTRESVADGCSGLLVDDDPRLLTAALRRVLTDERLRASLGDGAHDLAHRYSWEASRESFAEVVSGALQGVRTSEVDPDDEPAPVLLGDADPGDAPALSA